MSRSDVTGFDRMLFTVCRTAVVSVCRLAFRPRIVGVERIPDGPCVLAPSHRSILDTFFLLFVTRRRIRFMGKAELFRHRIPARLFRALGGFPVERGTPDRAALRSAVAAVEGGEPLAVFPEGTRRHGPLITDLHDGVAYVAARCGVPIVPVGIGGSEEILAKGRKIPKFRRVAIVVGEPIEVPVPSGSVRRGDVTALTSRLTDVLQRLFEDAEALSHK